MIHLRNMTAKTRQLSIGCLALGANLMLLSRTVTADECLASGTLNRPAYLKLLQSHQLERKPFETTEAWNTRAREAAGKIGTSVILAVRAKVKMEDFDADKGMLKIEIADQFSEFEGFTAEAQHYRGILLKPPIEHSKVYIGQNGYGAKRSVVEVSRKTFGIGYPQTNFSQIITIPMDPETARTSIASLSIAVVGEIFSPYAASGKFQRLPTFTFPVGNIYDDEILVVRPTCAVVLGKKAEVLMTFDPTAR